MSKKRLKRPFNTWDIGVFIFGIGTWATIFINLEWTSIASLAACMLCACLSMRLDRKREEDEKRGWGGWR